MVELSDKPWPERPKLRGEQPAGTLSPELLDIARDIADDPTLPLAVREGMILALHDLAVERAQLDLILTEYRRNDGRSE